MLVAGGDTAGISISSAELYDPATGTWSPTGSLHTNRSHHTATLLTNGKVLVAGGISWNNFPGAAELYDPATGTWSVTGSLGAERNDSTATLPPNGKVLIAGGLDYNPHPLASAELYDPATGIWSATGSLATPRYFHTATLLPNGKVLVAAGYDLYLYGTGEPTLGSAELYESFLNPILNPIKLGDGSIQFSFSNPSGPSYRILARPARPRHSTPGRTSGPPPNRPRAPATSSSPTIKRQIIHDASIA